MNRFRRLSIQDGSGLVAAAHARNYLGFFVFPIVYLLLMRAIFFPYVGLEVRSWPFPNTGYWPIVATITSLIATLVLLLSLARFLTWLRYRAFVASNISLHLLALIASLSSHQGFDQNDLRRDVIRQLEVIASLLEHRMPRYQAGRGLVSEAVSEHYLKVAQYLRSLQIWVAVPQDGTQKNLQEELVHAFWCSWDGRWHDLHQADARPRISKESLAKAAALAILPLGVFVTLHLLGLGVGLEIERWAFLFGASWALVKIISVLDPGASATLLQVKDVLGSYKDSKS